MILPHNLRPTSLKFRGVDNILRTINASFPAAVRVILVLSIVATFGMAIAGVKEESPVKGVRASDSEFVTSEINRTLKVIGERPDYTGAWMRLAVLYEQIGETDKADEARIEARRLNPDL